MSDDNNTVQTSDEVRTKVIEDFGFDNDTQSEQIDKLTSERIEHQKINSKTIQQKVKYREQGVKAGILDPNTFEPIEKKPDGTTFNKTNTEPSGEFREELIMIAQGRSKEEVDTLKVIAKGKGISLADAEKDPMFETMAGATKAAETKQKAQLGASNRGVVQTTSTDDRSSERAQKHAEMLRKMK